MSHTSTELYKPYDNKGHDRDSIASRARKRIDWWNGWIKDGLFEDELISIGVIKPKRGKKK
jgi:hypothetical protein